MEKRRISIPPNAEKLDAFIEKQKGKGNLAGLSLRPKTKQYQPKEDYDDYIVDEGRHSLIAMYLIDKGIASTRANVIAEVVRDCFKAVTPLDNYNSKLVSELLPEIFTLGKFYNDVYGDGTYPFHENVKEVKKV